MFYLLLSFAENQGVFWDFKIKNSIRITEGLDIGDSDNQGLLYIIAMVQWYAASYLLENYYIWSFGRHTLLG